ncbi:hypothetical protein JB92DRAFT_910967 [Gautieria morchelliformis]|nr:hypothetical protein JB92DRAFT_910967 [Gautieria morchelliformis]
MIAGFTAVIYHLFIHFCSTILPTLWLPLRTPVKTMACASSDGITRNRCLRARSTGHLFLLRPECPSPLSQLLQHCKH